jgi:hypothetical protein
MASVRDDPQVRGQRLPFLPDPPIDQSLGSAQFLHKKNLRI